MMLNNSEENFGKCCAETSVQTTYNNLLSDYDVSLLQYFSHPYSLLFFAVFYQVDKFSGCPIKLFNTSSPQIAEVYFELKFKAISQ